MENILDKTKKVGERIFYHPNPQLSYDYLSQYSLSSNTFRGFHRTDKMKPGAGKVFRDILKQQSNLIIHTIKNATKENDIDSLSNELVKILKFQLSKNINHNQLQSFNKIRKPVDIVIEHMVSMFEGFEEVRQKIIPFLFLPLDSQMFQSEFVFSDLEIKELKLSRNFTFQNIWEKSHYIEIQSLLNEKARKLGIDRIFFDLAWNNRFNSNGGNLFDTNPRSNSKNQKTFETNVAELKNQMPDKTLKSNSTMKAKLNTTIKGEDARKKEIIKNLDALRNKLIKEPEFKDYKFSNVDIRRKNDYCIWLFRGFSDVIGIQIKHQKETEKIAFNLRPIKYNRSLNASFIKLINKIELEVKNPNNEPYVGIQQTPVVVLNYKQGILREDFQEIKFQLISIIEWIKAIK